MRDRGAKEVSLRWIRDRARDRHVYAVVNGRSGILTVVGSVHRGWFDGKRDWIPMVHVVCAPSDQAGKVNPLTHELTSLKDAKVLVEDYIAKHRGRLPR